MPKSGTGSESGTSFAWPNSSKNRKVGGKQQKIAFNFKKIRVRFGGPAQSAKKWTILSWKSWCHFRPGATFWSEEFLVGDPLFWGVSKGSVESQRGLHRHIDSSHFNTKNWYRFQDRRQITSQMSSKYLQSATGRQIVKDFLKVEKNSLRKFLPDFLFLDENGPKKVASFLSPVPLFTKERSRKKVLEEPLWVPHTASPYPSENRLYLHKIFGPKSGTKRRMAPVLPGQIRREIEKLAENSTK